MRRPAPYRIPHALWRALAAAAVLLLPLALSGQAPPAPPRAAGPGEEVFGETIDVRAVNLEVVVEDRAGRRVSGLKPADFVLTVDGKPVPIDSFTEVAEGRAVGEGSAAAPGGVTAQESGDKRHTAA